MTFFLRHLFDAVFEKKKPVISGGRQASFSERANKDYLTRSRQCDYKLLSSDEIGSVLVGILSLPLHLNPELLKGIIMALQSFEYIMISHGLPN
jgi:hypothetical protein